jgi:hypothetical protein
METTGKKTRPPKKKNAPDVQRIEAKNAKQRKAKNNLQKTLKMPYLSPSHAKTFA